MLKAYKNNYKEFTDDYSNVVVPSYQRDYVWGKDEWEDFYNDIVNIIKFNFKPHFMGTLLLKRAGDSYEIIDGQQRLITLNIFLMAYRDYYQDNIEIKYILDILNNRIIVNDRDNIYESIYHGTYRTTRIVTDKESINIRSVYKYFLEKFKKKNLFKKITTDKNLLRTFKKLFFVIIEIDNKSSPYLIFETLNARGIDLNISDLVKNHLIDKSQDDTKFSDFINSEWEQLTLGLDSNSFEKLFQSYYLSLNNRKKLLKEITTTVNEKNEIEDFLRKLGKYVDLYKKLEDETVWDGNQDYIHFVKSLKSYDDNHLLKVLAIPLLISFPQRRRVSALKVIENLVFRYIIICQKSKETLIEKFYDVAKSINNKSIDSIQKLREALNEYIVLDDEFLSSFAYRSIEYSHRYSNPMVRYILYKIENFLVKDERYILGVSDASVEHINSQSHALVNEVYRLGNYTLLRQEENSRASNKEFVTKKDVYYDNSSFELTNGADNSVIKKLSSYSDWSLQNINTRQLEMANIAIKVWKI